MERAEERLKFAIRFAQMNLDQLRPGDWLNLRDDLDQFIYGGHEQRTQAWEEFKEVAERFALNRDLLNREIIRLAHERGRLSPPSLLYPPHPHEYPEDAFRVLQEDVRGLLRAFAGAARPGAATAPQWCVRGTFMVARGMEGEPVRLPVRMGPTRDVCLSILYALLEHEPTDAIRQCPECQTIFYRVRKQRYCTRTCTNRVNMREWRQTTGKATESDRNHTQYKARVRRKNSPNAKVTVVRRPRSRKPLAED